MNNKVFQKILGFFLLMCGMTAITSMIAGIIVEPPDLLIGILAVELMMTITSGSTLSIAAGIHLMNK